MLGSRPTAVFFLAAKPAEEGTLEQPKIQPISLRPPLLTGNWNARRMNDTPFHIMGAQPTGSQKPSRPASKAPTIRVMA